MPFDRDPALEALLPLKEEHVDTMDEATLNLASEMSGALKRFLSTHLHFAGEKLLLCQLLYTDDGGESLLQKRKQKDLETKLKEQKAEKTEEEAPQRKTDETARMQKENKDNKKAAQRKTDEPTREPKEKEKDEEAAQRKTEGTIQEQKEKKENESIKISDNTARKHPLFDLSSEPPPEPNKIFKKKNDSFTPSVDMWLCDKCGFWNSQYYYRCRGKNKKSWSRGKNNRKEFGPCDGVQTENVDHYQEDDGHHPFEKKRVPGEYLCAEYTVWNWPQTPYCRECGACDKDCAEYIQQKDGTERPDHYFRRHEKDSNWAPRNWEAFQKALCSGRLNRPK
ncbi:hypothetical protein BDV96DRAFT_655092 [Lophiotrema nucula]|uniref:RanBP2-type domain-containing protein n=1 Tax=Lophiotrema nucula TaxID=690887 RepID=A0A6A5YFW6_9PLEO|nr:hypothetical protein BDV96DRAFT_655092 [Lophiotrema nucula]